MEIVAFVPVSKIESTDIDYVEDFEIADAIFNHILKEKVNE